MEKKKRVGRNDPCPCGSGKKYKHCCGAVAELIHLDKALDSIRFNAKIAYLGAIGRKRQAFCIKYIKHKRKLIELISNKQIQAAQINSKTISCHKGCCYCCDEIFSISIQEGEAIVYYLYQHQNALNAFIQAFPRWLSQARKHEDIFMRRQQVATKGFQGQMTLTEMVDALGKEASSYWKLQIHCPFLNGGECLIYDVRPWACASLFSTSPTEWCSPSSIHKPNIYLAKLPTTPDLPFWDSRIAGRYEGNMPNMVYRLLTESIKFLSELPGLDKLLEEFLRDPELRDFIKQLSKHNTTY